MLAAGLAVVSCSGGDSTSAPAGIASTEPATTVVIAGGDDDPSGTTIRATPSTTQPVSSTTAGPAADLDADFTWLVAAAGARTIVAGDADRLLTWDGSDHRVVSGAMVLESTGRSADEVATLFVRSADDRFIYWAVAEAEDDPFEDWIAIATTYDGTVVCDLVESIHHVTERVDGTYVAGVERELESTIGAAPAFAVDCATGDAVAIQSFVSYQGDGEVRVTERVGGREFTFLGDAEGNADLLNEDGLQINGDDYSGEHALDRAGERVLYGDYGIGASPHLSRHLVARTTTDGALLWRAEVESWALFRGWTDSLIVVALAGSEVDPAEVSTAQLVLLDQHDGSVIERRPTTLHVLHLS